MGGICTPNDSPWLVQGFPRLDVPGLSLQRPNRAYHRLKIEPGNLATGQPGEPGYYPVASPNLGNVLPEAFRVKRKPQTPE